MTDWIRPGPMSIEPGACPGGVVIHAYSVPGQDLLLVSKLGPGDDVDSQAESDGAFAGTVSAATCLVFYDGDSGERMRPEEMP